MARTTSPIQNRAPRAATVGRGSVLAALVLAVTLAAGCDDGEATVGDPTDGGADVTTVPVDPGEPPAETAPAGGETWRAVEVVDGDTLDVAGPDGELTVRIVGINTPEIDECLYEEATDALAALVEGEDLVLVRDQSDVDQFGRALRYVELADGTDIGAALVEQGLAVARRYEPDTTRHAGYEALQRDAQEANVGLWAADACGPATTGVSIEVEVNPDAPGDDNENLNGEWVRLTNTGSEPVDLDGWQVADESATHRYDVDDVVLEPGGSLTLFTGCGDATDTAGDTTDDTAGDIDRYWCRTDSAVWNNDGDTVFLRDPNGNNVVVSSYSN